MESEGLANPPCLFIGRMTEAGPGHSSAHFYRVARVWRHVGGHNAFFF